MAGYIDPGSSPASDSRRVLLDSADVPVEVAPAQDGRTIALLHWDAGNTSYQDVRLTFLRRDAGGAYHEIRGPYAVGAFSNTGINLSGGRLARLAKGESLHARIDRDLDQEAEQPEVFSLQCNIVYMKA